MRMIEHSELRLTAGPATLIGDLEVPPDPVGLVLFAHGSGSSRRSERNRHVASVLNDGGLATLLFDLLTEDEARVDARTARFRFDIPLLAERLDGATNAVLHEATVGQLPIGYFGASTGAAAAIIAASGRPDLVRAVVSRGGRVDLAGFALHRLRSPILCLVGELDGEVLRMNREALAQISCAKRLEIIPGASHLFEEPRTLDLVAEDARDWLTGYLAGSG
jgi:pimeloyl-ACP methyl ester carboxylesterase